jgi:hypothetical protein
VTPLDRKLEDAAIAFEQAEDEALDSARLACVRAMEIAGIDRLELSRRLAVDKSTLYASLRAGKPGARAKSMALRSFVRILIACGVEPTFEIRENAPEPTYGSLE